MLNFDYSNRPPLPPVPADRGPEPYVVDIVNISNHNRAFRNALWTGENLQVTLMALPPAGDIGVEMHGDTDQMLVVTRGAGTLLMGKSPERPDLRREIRAGEAVFVPAGTWHNIISDRQRPMNLYSVYAPPHHDSGTLRERK